MPYYENELTVNEIVDSCEEYFLELHSIKIEQTAQCMDLMRMVAKLQDDTAGKMDALAGEIDRTRARARAVLDDLGYGPAAAGPAGREGGRG